MAKNLNIDHSYIPKMEKGQHPSIPILFRLSEYFEVNSDYLLTGRKEDETLKKWKSVIDNFEERDVEPEDVMQFLSLINKIVCK